MFELQYKKGISLMVVVLLVVGSLYLFVKAVSVFMSEDMMGSKMESTITLTGHGETKVAPDIASVYFTIRKEAKTSKEAQEMVAEVEKKALDFLKQNGVEDKYIKAESVSFYPKYEYKYETSIMAPCNEYGCPPRPGKSVVTGYEASEGISVKIKDLDSVGKIMDGLATAGVGELSGPNFEIEDEEEAKADARKKAIDEAKEKAEVLARDLGVRLGKVVSFNESGNYYPMYMRGGVAMDMAKAESAPAQIPQGENTISSDVTITYEIK